MYNVLNTDIDSLMTTLENSLHTELHAESVRSAITDPIRLSQAIMPTGLESHILETALLKIFENDKKRLKPVFSQARKDSISRLAKLVANPDRRLKIGITGVSASGKTTILDTLLRVLNKYGIKQDIHYTRINQDNYYKDTSGLVKEHGGKSEFINATGFNFDIPDALDLDDLVKDISGNMYAARTYNKKTCEVCVSSMPKMLGKFIVVDGLFCLNPRMRDAFDIGIFIQTSSEQVKKRWYARAKKRDLVGSAADFVFETAMKEANIHILPHCNSADFIIDGDVPLKEIKATFIEFIKIIMQG